MKLWNFSSEKISTHFFQQLTRWKLFLALIRLFTPYLILTYPLYFSNPTFHFLLFLYSKWPQMSWMVLFKFNLNFFGKLMNKRIFLALPNKLKEGSIAIIVLSRFDVLFYFDFSGIYYFLERFN